MSLCSSSCTTVHAWRSEDTLLGIVLSFNHIGPGIKCHQEWQKVFLPTEPFCQPPFFLMVTYKSDKSLLLKKKKKKSHWKRKNKKKENCKKIYSEIIANMYLGSKNGEQLESSQMWPAESQHPVSFENGKQGYTLPWIKPSKDSLVADLVSKRKEIPLSTTHNLFWQYSLADYNNKVFLAVRYP